MDLNKFKRHQSGCRGCEECLAGYPTLCQCGGLIHAEYEVKEEKGKFVNVGPQMNCDKCGTKFFRANSGRRRVRGNNYGRNSKFNESNRGPRPKV
jgi:hypothetical protein